MKKIIEICKKSEKQGSPRSARGLLRTFCFLLFIIVLSFPVNVFASSYSADTASFHYQNGGYTDYNKTLPYSINRSDMVGVAPVSLGGGAWSSQNNALTSLTIRFTFENVKFNVGDNIIITLKSYENSRYYSWYKYSYYGDGSDHEVNTIDGGLTANYNRATGVYTFSFTCNEAVNGSFGGNITLSNPNYNGSTYDNVYFKTTSILLDYESAEKGLLNSVLSIVKNIQSNVTDLPTKLKQFFDNIVSSIDNLPANLKSFFDDLGNKISSGFNNIKTWFTDLTSSIGDFFNNLWGNLNNFFNELGEFLLSVVQNVKDWWNGVKEFWDNLWHIPEDFFDEYKQLWLDWLEEHFGFLYQTVSYTKDYIGMLHMLNNFDYDNFYFDVPTISFPDNINIDGFSNFIIVSSQRIYFDDIFKPTDTFNTILNIFKSVMSATFFFGFLILMKKKLYGILGASEKGDL